MLNSSRQLFALCYHRCPRIGDPQNFPELSSAFYIVENPYAKLTLYLVLSYFLYYVAISVSLKHHVLSQSERHCPLKFLSSLTVGTLVAFEPPSISSLVSSQVCITFLNVLQPSVI